MAGRSRRTSRRRRSRAACRCRPGRRAAAGGSATGCTRTPTRTPRPSRSPRSSARRSSGHLTRDRMTIGIALPCRARGSAIMTNEPQNQGTLTVHGEGQVKAKPDLVRVSLSVITEAKTAVEAVQQNGAQTETVLPRVQALGVPDGGLRTAGGGVYPIIQYQAGTSRIVGYRP